MNLNAMFSELAKSLRADVRAGKAWIGYDPEYMGIYIE